MSKKNRIIQYNENKISHMFIVNVLLKKSQEYFFLKKIV